MRNGCCGFSGPVPQPLSIRDPSNCRANCKRECDLPSSKKLEIDEEMKRSRDETERVFISSSLHPFIPSSIFLRKTHLSSIDASRRSGYYPHTLLSFPNQPVGRGTLICRGPRNRPSRNLSRNRDHVSIHRPSRCSFGIEPRSGSSTGT
jgi:hypothetical protein